MATMKDAGTDNGVPYVTEVAKKSYPRLCLDLDKFPELNEVGKSVELTIRGKVVSVSQNDNGGHVDVEVEECGVESEEKEDDESNKADSELGKLAGSKPRY